MNENLNLVEILKDCQKGTKLYSPIFGDVFLSEIREGDKYPISIVSRLDKETISYDFDYRGLFFRDFDGECMLFPARKQRDWSKFREKEPKFGPKTLQPFDRVLVRHKYGCWKCELFSHFDDEESEYKCICVGSEYCYCIPYNEETKHLVGTMKEAPEYYRYWED